MQKKETYTDLDRLTARVLTLHYLENLSQVEIAKRLGLSTVKINRLIKSARKSGLVEINLKLPFPSLSELESRILAMSDLEDIIISPSIGNTQNQDLAQLAQVAGSSIVNMIRANDMICVGGGRTILEIINFIDKQIIPGVRIVPAIGGVQNLNDGDVNSIATRLANKLGGESINFYAPAFAETETECEMFFKLTHINKVLEQAKSARIGLFGVGNLQIDSSIIQYCSLPYNILEDLVRKRGAIGEILIYAIDDQGKECIPELNKRVVGISLDDFRRIPVRIGAAIGSVKAPAIAAAIWGNFFTHLFIDENAAKDVITILEKRKFDQSSKSFRLRTRPQVGS